MKADNNDKELIMRRAWIIYGAEKGHRTFGESLWKAWEIQRLVSLMREGSAKFIYRKADGEGRRAFGTLYSPRIGEKPKGAGRKPNPGVVNYWYMDRNAWRSFRVTGFQGIG